MNKPLRVLLIEDSEDDATLILHELRRGGFAPEFAQVAGAKELVLAFEDQKWDLILSDHSMPGFSSLEALEYVKQQEVDIPFILVSGAIGEELAVKVMKAGANDYVMKDHLARLVPSVERELREAANRKARRTAEETTAYLAAIVDSSEDAIIGTTLEGVILSWNEGARRMYGYLAEEVIGSPIAILGPTFRPEELPAIYARIANGERIDRRETVRLRKDRSTIDVSLVLSPIRDQKGRVIGVSSNEADITLRKLEEEERLKLISELTDALARIKTLRGLLPICASCKKIRDDRGYWQKVESYITDHTEAEFTHGICPECITRLYPEYAIKK